MNKTYPPGNPKLAIAWWVVFLIAMIISSLSAKYLSVMAAFLSAIAWVPPKSYPFYVAGAMISIGLMLAAPLWSAMFFALTPYSRPVRLGVALTWFGIAIFAQFLGYKALPEFESPSAFRPETLPTMPIITLGWCLPFVLMRVFRGWQIQFAGSETRGLKANFSIASLLMGTFLVALCLAPVTFVRPPVQLGGLIGMLFAIAAGFVALPVVWYTMRVKHYVLFSIGFAVLVYTVSFLAFFSISGSARDSLFLPGMFVSLSLGLISLFVGARIYGARLITSRDNLESSASAIGETKIAIE